MVGAAIGDDPPPPDRSTAIRASAGRPCRQRDERARTDRGRPFAMRRGSGGRGREPPQAGIDEKRPSKRLFEREAEAA